MNQQTGKYIILAGVVTIIIGTFIYFFSNQLKWFGKLPGDVRIEKENYRYLFSFFHHAANKCRFNNYY